MSITTLLIIIAVLLAVCVILLVFVLLRQSTSRAVTKLARQLSADPEPMKQAKMHAESIRAAAWLHYIELLGKDLRKAQEVLSNTQRWHMANSYEFSFYVGPEQHAVDTIRAKLDAAVKEALPQVACYESLV